MPHPSLLAESAAVTQSTCVCQMWIGIFSFSNSWFWVVRTSSAHLRVGLSPDKRMSEPAWSLRMTRAVPNRWSKDQIRIHNLFWFPEYFENDKGDKPDLHRFGESSPNLDQDSIFQFSVLSQNFQHFVRFFYQFVLKHSVIVPTQLIRNRQRLPTTVSSSLLKQTNEREKASS